MVYNHHQIFRNNCLGNFKQMVRLVTTDPAMLRYLNGYLSIKTAPDKKTTEESYKNYLQ